MVMCGNGHVRSSEQLVEVDLHTVELCCSPISLSQMPSQTVDHVYLVQLVLSKNMHMSVYHFPLRRTVAHVSGDT